LASSTSIDQPFCVSIGDERERLVTASPMMAKSWDPSWGKQLPGEKPSEIDET
jgi:hypothetical protein